jgi:lysozyme
VSGHSAGFGSRVVMAAALAAAAATAAFVRPWEGEPLDPYRDIVGVWTVCAGITRNVEQRRYTRAECRELLKDEVAIHLSGVAKCINRPLRENEWVAIGSWTFNVGVGAACKSTLVRKVNSGAPASAWCPELLKWDRAGGRKVYGLTRRRTAEYRVCMGAA